MRSQPCCFQPFQPQTSSDPKVSSPPFALWERPSFGHAKLRGVWCWLVFLGIVGWTQRVGVSCRVWKTLDTTRFWVPAGYPPGYSSSSMLTNLHIMPVPLVFSISISLRRNLSWCKTYSLLPQLFWIRNHMYWTIEATDWLTHFILTNQHKDISPRYLDVRSAELLLQNNTKWGWQKTP